MITFHVICMLSDLYLLTNIIAEYNSNKNLMHSLNYSLLCRPQQVCNKHIVKLGNCNSESKVHSLNNSILLY